MNPPDTVTRDVTRVESSALLGADTVLPGRFITFEGIEGTGKTTQLELLIARLIREGRDVVATREPGGTELGRELRALVLRPAEQPMSPEAELMLYVADRAQHLSERILPALERGAIVLCDRYLDATLAYQGFGRGLDLEWIRELHRRPPLDCRPHRTLLFDLDPALGLSRARRRNRELDVATTEGRFEEERLEFHERVRRGYLELAMADPDRIRIVEADGEIAQIEERVTELLSDLLPPAESGPC